MYLSPYVVKNHWHPAVFSRNFHILSDFAFRPNLKNHTSGYLDFGKVTKNVTLVEYYVIIYIGDTKGYIKQADPEIESQSAGDRD